MSYKSYISKVFKQEHSDKTLSGKSKNVLDSLAMDTFEKIAEAAKVCLKLAKRETLMSRDIQSAVQLVYAKSDSLTKKAIACGTKAVTKLTSADDGARTRSQAKKSRTSKTDSAGLIFPVTRVKTLLKEFGFKRVSPGAGAYLAAVIQCIVSEVGEEAVRDLGEKKSRLSNRSIGQGIQLDEDLFKIYGKVTIASSGVVPLTPEQLKAMYKPKKSDFHHGLY
jgi:histone H3/H4